MADEIKITSLNSIGGNLSTTSLTAVVDMTGSPVTKKANIQQLGNFILANAGTANFAPAGLALLAQTVSNSNQPNITSVGTLSTLTVTGNINGSSNLTITGQVSGNIFVGNGYSLSNINGANVVGSFAGNVSNATYANISGIAYGVSGSNVSGQVANSLVSGTVYTNSQPNITSVGTLTSLTVSGNISANVVSANSFSGNGSLLTSLSPANMNSIPGAQRLVIDPSGSDVTGDGSINKPFASVQAAHNYAVTNIGSSLYVVLQVNPGNYSGNVVLTRPRTSIIGASDGDIRASWITGTITINMTSGATVLSSDIFGLENLIVTSDSANVITLAGDQRYAFFARNVYAYTSGSTNSVLAVTNTSVGGIRLDLFKCNLQSAGGGTVLSTTNTYYLNINNSLLQANSGPALSTSTTTSFISTTRMTTQTGSNVVVSGTPFTSGQSMSFGVCTFESSATNGNGIYLLAGSVTTLGYCAFNVPSGTGKAVGGDLGSVLVKSANNNQIAYNTNGNTGINVTVLSMNYL